MVKLKKNERLIYAGETALRAPDGTPLPSVPQYMIVSAEEANPNSIVSLQKNERLVLAGHVFNGKKAAEQRFAEMKAGYETTQREDSVPLYIKEDVSNINKKTGNTEKTDKAIKALSADLLATFAIQMRKIKALEKQGIK